jgi:hypothetical protein
MIPYTVYATVCGKKRYSKLWQLRSKYHNMPQRKSEWEMCYSIARMAFLFSNPAKKHLAKNDFYELCII